MEFVPIPSDRRVLEKSEPLWLPFLERIARRNREDVRDPYLQVYRGAVQIGLVWDGKRPHALIGLRYVRRGDELVGEICWLTGTGRRNWQELLPQVERYLREHIGCIACRPVCRLGWWKFLRARGYRPTHVIMEKAL